MSVTKHERIESILRHMKHDAEDAIRFAQLAGTYELFLNDELIRKGVVMSIINIGELTKQLPDDYKDAHAEIPWKQIAHMRNHAVHGYHSVKLDIVWETARESIPEFLRFVEEQLALYERGERP